LTIVIYKLKGIVNSEIGMSSRIVIKKKISKVKKQFKERTEKFNAIFNNEDLRKIIMINKFDFAIKMKLDDINDDEIIMTNIMNKKKINFRTDLKNTKFKNKKEFQDRLTHNFHEIMRIFFRIDWIQCDSNIAENRRKYFKSSISVDFPQWWPKWGCEGVITGKDFEYKYEERWFNQNGVNGFYFILNS
jgi:hypothetical protein